MKYQLTAQIQCVVNGEESEGWWYRMAVNTVGHYGLKHRASSRVRATPCRSCRSGESLPLAGDNNVGTPLRNASFSIEKARNE